MAAISGMFWPKIFWDWLTTNLDPAVKPIPILQSINLIMGFVMLAWEYPLGFLAGSGFHRSLEIRLAVLPLATLASILLYQGSNAALYYLASTIVYFWAYSEGEVRSFSSFLCLRTIGLTSSRSLALSHGPFRKEAPDSQPARSKQLAGLLQSGT